MGTMCFHATIDRIAVENGLEKIVEQADIGYYASPWTAMDATEGLLNERYDPKIAKKIIKAMTANRPKLPVCGCMGEVRTRARHSYFDSSGYEHEYRRTEIYRVYIMAEEVLYEPTWQHAFFH